MKNKIQKVEYINGNWCSTINEYYLKDDWYIVMIVPATTRDHVGAYVLLEKEIQDEIIVSDNLINTFTNFGITLYDNKGTIKPLNQILKEISQKWEELIVYDKRERFETII